MTMENIEQENAINKAAKKEKKIIVKRENKKRYYFLATILLLASLGLVFLPRYEKIEGIKTETLFGNTISTERYITTDQLANKIISQDPSCLLIDLRDELSFNEFTLKNAINIPLEKLMDEEFAGYIIQKQYDLVFFSNDHYNADQAWILCNRLGIKNIRVLKGGLNEWYNTILNPQMPNEMMSQTDHDLYNFRKAAGQYFGVGVPNTTKEEVPKPVAKKAVVPIKKVKEEVTEGGC
jgi:rhodanese-related sulfurtransferase